MHSQEATEIPKTIWLMWLQGLDRAPQLVKRCYDSWRHHNPGWRVIFLDETNLHHYVDVDAPLASDNDIQVQAKSDIIRVNLLARHGGVWVDATCFCCRPLDSWLEGHAPTGFFAFSSVAASRPIEAWFMASSRACYLTTRLAEVSNSYWLSNRGLKKRPDETPLAKLVIRALSFNPITARLWLSYPVRRGLRVYPYMWLPFLFDRLLRQDPRCRQIWRETREISNRLPSGLQFAGLLEPLTERAQREIDDQISPLYKLNWRHDTADTARYEGSVLHYLLEQIGAPQPDVEKSGLENRSRPRPTVFKPHLHSPKRVDAVKDRA